MPCELNHDPPAPRCHLCGRRGLVPWPPGAAPGPCPHLGPQVGEEECESCRGRVRLRVFACASRVHGPATTLPKCAGCDRAG